MQKIEPMKHIKNLDMRTEAEKQLDEIFDRDASVRNINMPPDEVQRLIDRLTDDRYKAIAWLERIDKRLINLRNIRK